MKIKELIYDFCQKYLYQDEENFKPTIKLFFYSLYRTIRGLPPIFFFRMLFQKIFRFNHISDCELWETSDTMAKKILPLLYAFKKMKRHGIPNIYSEYDENSGWESKEAYDEAVKNGTIIGGGEEVWERDIDHIIHSLEYVAWESSKKINKWYIDNFGMDPYSEDIRNKYKYYTFKNKGSNGLRGMTFHNPPDREVENLEEHESYGNHELLQYIDNYVNAGLMKLGYLWRNFWD
jgi:hypothetical protein